jgi:cell division protein FtsI (penicillin-binding protein 3)
MINSRAIIIIVVMILAFTALVAKLFDVQIIKSDELKYYAQRQQMKIEKIKPERGLIYDRNSVLLAYNRNDISFYLDLRMVKASDKEKIAEKFSKIFGKTKNHYLKLMNEKGKTICIEKKASSEKAMFLNDFEVRGLFFNEDPTRVYHYDNLAAHVVGYVGDDLTGKNGIENFYDKILKGEEGIRLVERNAIGDMITVSEEETRPAIAGNDIYLTINKSYQTILEEELAAGLTNYGGTSATGVLMDPNTGEVLAMANMNDYNPNKYWIYSNDERRNEALTDTYEPGSTFKVFTMAALLDQSLAKETENVYVENGRFKFKSAYINDTHKHNTLTVRGVMEQSSNIGIAKLVQRIDNDLYYKYLRGFGFGNFTSISLPGESKGKLKKPGDWGTLTKAFMSFGYEISVTPIQLAAAYSAVVNGGILYQPQIVRRTANRDGNKYIENPPKEIRRVISEETSVRMRNILLSVVSNGTAKNAIVEGFLIGGKTGTSQKLVDGRYSKSSYNSSFAGFFPADNPKIVCLVLVNSPDKGKYGGMVAAPIFKKVAERIINTKPEMFKNPQQQYYEDEQTQIIYAENNSGTVIPIKNVKEFSHEDALELISKDLMPDLTNSTLRDAIAILSRLGLKYKVNGSGNIVSQSIRPGEKIKRGMTCTLNCSSSKSKGVVY